MTCCPCPRKADDHCLTDPELRKIVRDVWGQNVMWVGLAVVTLLAAYAVVAIGVLRSGAGDTGWHFDGHADTAGGPAVPAPRPAPRTAPIDDASGTPAPTDPEPSDPAPTSAASTSESPTPIPTDSTPEPTGSPARTVLWAGDTALGLRAFDGVEKRTAGNHHRGG